MIVMVIVVDIKWYTLYLLYSTIHIQILDRIQAVIRCALFGENVKGLEGRNDAHAGPDAEQRMKFLRANVFTLFIHINNTIHSNNNNRNERGDFNG